MSEITPKQLAAYFIEQSNLREGNPYRHRSDTEQSFARHKEKNGHDPLVSHVIGKLGQNEIGKVDPVGSRILWDIGILYGTMYQGTPLPEDYRWKAAPPLEILAHYNLTGRDISHLYVNVCGNGKTGDMNRFLKFLIALDEKQILPEELFSDPKRAGHDMNYAFRISDERWQEIDTYVAGRIRPKGPKAASTDTDRGLGGM